MTVRATGGAGAGTGSAGTGVEPEAVPGRGANVLERIENIQNGTFDPVEMQRKLDEFTARAAAVGRSVFGGELSYAAAQDDEVDWDLFDTVSYAIVKPVQDTPGDPESPWHWEPKEAYHALASRYARAAARR